MRAGSRSRIAIPGAGGTLLAISGSLRGRSTNSAALRAAARAAARDGISVDVVEVVRDLPAFDPDLDERPPDPVRRFRRACDEARGFLVAVPEYTFGIPGAFKNALDWVVGSGSLYRKPVLVLRISSSERGVHVGPALDLALRAHGADVRHRWVPVSRRDLDARGEVGDPQLLARLRAVVGELAEASFSPPTAQATLSQR